MPIIELYADLYGTTHFSHSTVSIGTQFHMSSVVVANNFLIFYHFGLLDFNHIQVSNAYNFC